jgi:hypothetical protein
MSPKDEGVTQASAVSAHVHDRLFGSFAAI